MSDSTGQAEAGAVRARGGGRVAVVIGSGGIKCAAGVGLWKVLDRENIPVELVVGCSGGSIYAAAMALGMDVKEAESRTYEMWEGLFGRVHYRSVLRGLLPSWFGASERLGVINDRAVSNVMESLYGDADFSDTKIPLRIAATDFRTGERVEISSGSIADAVRASIAIPLLLRPWPINGRLLVDGGASDPLPVSIAIREGADIILAMGFESAPKEDVKSLVEIAVQSSSIAINHLLRSTYAFYSAVHHAEIVPIMPIFTEAIRVTDTDKLPVIVARGAESAEEEIPYIRRLLEAREAAS